MVRGFKPTNGKTGDGISKILSDTIILNYNWDGTKNKESIKNLVMFNNALFGKQNDK